MDRGGDLHPKFHPKRASTRAHKIGFDELPVVPDRSQICIRQTMGIGPASNFLEDRFGPCLEPPIRTVRVPLENHSRAGLLLPSLNIHPEGEEHRVSAPSPRMPGAIL